MLHILFENDDIIAIDKPVDLACIAERNKQKYNLHSQLSAMYSHKIFIVHRLDKEASGVVLFAKNATAHRCLCRQFTKHTVHKSYLALVHGEISGDSGTIDKPIRQFGSCRVAVDMSHGKPCVTEYEVIERFNGFTLVCAHPVTGRRHQLRVHFYSIGHAIVDDPLYGLRETSDERRGMKDAERHTTYNIRHTRLMLHAGKITFSLPSGQEMTIEAPPPESFIQVIESLRKVI